MHNEHISIKGEILKREGQIKFYTLFNRIKCWTTLSSLDFFLQIEQKIKQLVACFKNGGIPFIESGPKNYFDNIFLLLI